MTEEEKEKMVNVLEERRSGELPGSQEGRTEKVLLDGSDSDSSREGSLDSTVVKVTTEEGSSDPTMEVDESTEASKNEERLAKRKAAKKRMKQAARTRKRLEERRAKREMKQKQQGSENLPAEPVAGPSGSVSSMTKPEHQGRKVSSGRGPTARNRKREDMRKPIILPTGPADAEGKRPTTSGRTPQKNRGSKRARETPPSGGAKRVSREAKGGTGSGQEGLHISPLLRDKRGPLRSEAVPTGDSRLTSYSSAAGSDKQVVITSNRTGGVVTQEEATVIRDSIVSILALWIQDGS